MLTFPRLSITFYTSLKKERKNASYSTHILFDDKKTQGYHRETVRFLNKVKMIVT